MRAAARVSSSTSGAAAILSTAFERPVDPLFLARLRRAVALWNDGEPALAQLHLIFAGLPPCDDSDIVLRIFVAEEMLKAGVGPDILLKAQGADPAKAHYNPDQPRDAHGRWGDGEAEAEPAAYRGKGRLKAIGRFLEEVWSWWRRSHGQGEAERPPHEESKPGRPEAAPSGDRLEYAKPDSATPEANEGTGLELPADDANKLRHVFDKSAHQLDGLVDHFGSRETAFQAIAEATRKAIMERNISGPYEVAIQIGPYSVTVKGRVLDGKLRIGTVYIPWKR